MKFDKNEIFSLWIKNPPTKLNYYCWQSWIDLNYKVTLFYDDLKLFSGMPLRLKQKIQLRDVTSLPFFNIDSENLLQFTDVWRFMFLLNYGGTWLDSDIFLMRRLPDFNIILSSERTFQSGGRKCKDLFRPNIGALRFPPYHPFVLAVVDKIRPLTKEDKNDSKNSTSKMIKYQKLLKTKKWLHMNQYVLEPDAFCPIDAPFAKEIYMNDINEEVKSKYGLTYNRDFSNSYGIHLWNNVCRLKKIDFENETNIHKNSLWNQLKDLKTI